MLHDDDDERLGEIVNYTCCIMTMGNDWEWKRYLLHDDDEEGLVGVVVIPAA